jgi:hypothetical protein
MVSVLIVAAIGTATMTTGVNSGSVRNNSVLIAIELNSSDIKIFTGNDSAFSNSSVVARSCAISSSIWNDYDEISCVYSSGDITTTVRTTIVIDVVTATTKRISMVRTCCGGP